MPELPEVETVCRGLRAAALAAPVTRVWRSDYDLRIGAYWARAHEGSRKLVAMRPGVVSRRGKYILWSFAGGSPQELTMVVHLGMTGALRVHRRGDPVQAHTHLKIFFEDDRRVDYVDPRRFGGLRVDDEDAHRRGPLGKLGPEPLGNAFCGPSLHRSLQRRRIAVRDALLDQKIVAGVGNIYAVESLYAVRIHPARPALALSEQDCVQLVAALKRSLRRAIDLGGTTLRDYRGATGEQGRHQHELGVYGRQGEACGRCGAEIERVMLGGRSAFYCPRCQGKSQRARRGAEPTRKNPRP